MKSTTQIDPRRPSRVTRRPERSVRAKDGTSPYRPSCSRSIEIAGGTTRRATSIAPPMSTTAAAPSIPAMITRRPTRFTALPSQRPVHERVVQPGGDKDGGGDAADRALQPAHRPGESLHRSGTNGDERRHGEQRQRRPDREQARERPAPGAPERQRKRQPEEQPEERRAEGEREDEPEHVRAANAAAPHTASQAGGELVPDTDPWAPESEEDETDHDHERPERFARDHDDRD